jgi:hypothetical protein
MCYPPNHPCQPFSSKEVCSICKQPYNPDAAQRLPESFTMHFCPRDTCQTAWHRECLSTHHIRKRPTCTDRKLSLLCSIPTEFLEHSASPDLPPARLPLCSPFSRNRNRLLLDLNPGLGNANAHRKPTSLFGDLPSELTELASQPIVKPTFLHPLSFMKNHPSDTRGKERPPKNRRTFTTSLGISRWCSKHASSSTMSSVAPPLSRGTGERR